MICIEYQIDVNKVFKNIKKMVELFNFGHLPSKA